MKINRNNTALQYLDPAAPLNFGVALTKDKNQNKASLMGAQAKDSFPTLRTRCLTGKVRYICEPFEDAYESAKDRLRLDMTDHGDVIQESGVFIFKVRDGAGKGGYNTIYYSFNCGPMVEPDGEQVYQMKGSIMAFCSLKHYPQPALFAAYYITRDKQKISWFCNEMEEGKAGSGGAFELFVDTLYLVLFLRYCPVETKIIPAGRKAEVTGMKYLNDTKSTVEIVDSTWFTTIIRTEGFGVKGHFRLQPYPKLGTKKFIYIAPFEKKGYTRKAKVLNNGNNEIGSRSHVADGAD